jgi:uncharacterized protein with beta-barrel porin domain
MHKVHVRMSRPTRSAQELLSQGELLFQFTSKSRPFPRRALAAASLSLMLAFGLATASHAASIVGANGGDGGSPTSDSTGGAGGDGAGNPGSGGAGGVAAGGTGIAGSNGTGGGGGGGGATTNGGAGGNSDFGTGGPVGTITKSGAPKGGGEEAGGSGAFGGSSAIDAGGGGGGGGGRGETISTGSTIIQAGDSVTGGNGGKGGNGNGSFGDGGGGGGGGIGVVFTGAGALTVSGTIVGGNGGAGGDGGLGFGPAGSISGGGGAGASGLQTTQAGAMVIVNGTVTGGNGGANGVSQLSPSASGGGAGGAGIVAATITNNGTVTGGTGGSTSAAGGGGGTGGAGGIGAVVTGTMMSSNSTMGTIIGGNGGVGAAAEAGDAGNGGNGGNGGSGLSITAAGATFTNQGTITAGNGGASSAGAGSSFGGGNGGNGGAGGVGVALTASGATLTNQGTIVGGNGAAGGAGGADTGNEVPPSPGVAGNNGAGGAAVSGSNLTIVNSGSIIGGLNGDGVTRANAITFTGGTNTLELRAGSTIIGNVVGTGGNTLALGGATSGTFDVSAVGATRQYQGFSALQKIGTSNWTVTGTQTTTAAWVVNAGVLSVNGDISSSSGITVNAGGTLGGTGTVAATTINSGGALAPGNSIGTITVNGNLTFATGSNYNIEVSPSAANRTNATGIAALAGTVNATYAAGSYTARQYTILNAAGGIAGTFDALNNVSMPSTISASLSYDANDVFLNLALSFATPGGLSTNQQNVANALTNYFSATGGIPTAFTALNANGLSQVSGETATGSQQTTFDAMGQFMSVMTDPFMNRSGGFGGSSSSSGYAEEGGQASAYAASKKTDAFAMFTKAPPAPTFEQRWSVWAAGYGGSQSTDGNSVIGSNNTTSNVAATAVGADYLLSPSTIAGFAVAGGGTSFSVANGGTGRSDLFQAGAYVRHSEGPAYLSAALAYGWQDITTNRTVTVAGPDQLRAEFNANAFSGRLEGGYRLVSPATSGIGITPYAAAQFVTFDLPSYAESVLSGRGTFAMAYRAENVTDARTELGFRTDKSFAMADVILTLRSRFAWVHDYDPDRSISATFQTLPGASFVVNGAAQASDAALTTASIEMKWRNGWSAAATFESEFSDVTSSYAGKGVIKYAW